MKITNLQCLHADAGFRNFDFLKVTTDQGLVGWSEYNESFGGQGITSLINGCRPPASERRGRATGHRRDRKRAFGRESQGPGDPRLRDARRAGARQDPTLLVALRHLSARLAE